jgi:hypothetical protein
MLAPLFSFARSAKGLEHSAFVRFSTMIQRLLEAIQGLLETLRIMNPLKPVNAQSERHNDEVWICVAWITK